jgi:hypothetical protein
MAYSSVTPGPPIVTPDNTQVIPKSDNWGNTLVQAFGGRYAEAVRRGIMFEYNLPAAGQAIVIAAAGGGIPTIWNPSTSGKLCFIAAVGITWLSTATTVSALVLTFTLKAGSQIFPTAPISTFTTAPIINSLKGSANTSGMLWSPTTNVFAAAPANNVSFGANMQAANSAGFSDFWDIGGLICLAPGVAMSLSCSVATTTSALNGTIWAWEVPAPTNF